MRKLLKRIRLHCGLYIIICLITKFLESYTALKIDNSDAIEIITCIALIAAIEEVLLFFSSKKYSNDRDRVFRTIAIRSLAFLLVLFLTIPFIWYATEETKLFNGLLIVALYVLYSIVEIQFIRSH